MATNPCDCRLTGEFHSFRLYDHDGRECFTLAEACKAAELVYGSDWSEVFNGDQGTDRDEWRHSLDVALEMVKS